MLREVKYISKRFGGARCWQCQSQKGQSSARCERLGPSGSGKTTFLRCLNHLEKADGGQLTLAGKDYDLAKLNKRILEIGERRPLSSSIIISLPIKLTLEKYLRGLVVARKIPEEALEIAEDALSALGFCLQGLLSFTQLSGGQQRQLGLPAPLLSSQMSILLDSPTSALDRNWSAKCSVS